MIMRIVYKGGKRENYIKVNDFEIQNKSEKDKFITIHYFPDRLKSAKTKLSIILDPQKYEVVELWNDTLRECIRIITPEGIVK